MLKRVRLLLWELGVGKRQFLFPLVVKSRTLAYGEIAWPGEWVRKYDIIAGPGIDKTLKEKK